MCGEIKFCVFGSKFNLAKLEITDSWLSLRRSSHCLSVVRYPGVLLDAELSTKQHIITMAAICFYRDSDKFVVALVRKSQHSSSTHTRDNQTGLL